MTVICPAILAESQQEYRQQMQRIAGFASRIQIDLMDGRLTAGQSVALEQVWWPDNLIADIHLMYRQPMDYLDKIIELKPHMAIVHVEAEADFANLARQLHNNDIKAGLAVLPDTTIKKIEPFLAKFDHLMIFSGSLGRFGGRVDFKLLDKAAEAKSKFPALEIGWDGGINNKNAKKLAEGGVDVLNVGGFIQRSKDARAAYSKLLIGITE